MKLLCTNKKPHLPFTTWNGCESVGFMDENIYESNIWINMWGVITNPSSFPSHPFLPKLPILFFTNLLLLIILHPTWFSPHITHHNLQKSSQIYVNHTPKSFNKTKINQFRRNVSWKNTISRKHKHWLRVTHQLTWSQTSNMKKTQTLGVFTNIGTKSWIQLSQNKPTQPNGTLSKQLKLCTK